MPSRGPKDPHTRLFCAASSKWPSCTLVHSLLLLLLLTEVTGQSYKFHFTSNPDVAQCVSAVFSWIGGLPPYRVTIYPPPPDGQGSFVMQASSFTWTPHLPPGTNGYISIEDSNMANIVTEFIVAENPDGTCPDHVSSSSAVERVSPPTGGDAPSSMTESSIPPPPSDSTPTPATPPPTVVGSSSVSIKDPPAATTDPVPPSSSFADITSPTIFPTATRGSQWTSTAIDTALSSIPRTNSDSDMPSPSTPSSAATSAPSQSSQTRAGPTPGAVAGVAVTLTILIVCHILLILWCLRRRKRCTEKLKACAWTSWLYIPRPEYDNNSSSDRDAEMHLHASSLADRPYSEKLGFLQIPHMNLGAGSLREGVCMSLAPAKPSQTPRAFDVGASISDSRASDPSFLRSEPSLAFPPVSPPVSYDYPTSRSSDPIPTKSLRPGGLGAYRGIIAPHGSGLDSLHAASSQSFLGDSAAHAHAREVGPYGHYHQAGAIPRRMEVDGGVSLAGGRPTEVARRTLPFSDVKESAAGTSSVVEARSEARLAFELEGETEMDMQSACSHSTLPPPYAQH